MSKRYSPEHLKHYLSLGVNLYAVEDGGPRKKIKSNCVRCPHEFLKPDKNAYERHSRNHRGQTLTENIAALRASASSGSLTMEWLDSEGKF